MGESSPERGDRAARGRRRIRPSRSLRRDRAVRDLRSAARATFRQLLARLRGRFWALIGWTVLQGVGYLLLVLLAVALAVPLFVIGAMDGTSSAIVGGILVLVGSGLVALALGVWLSTKLALVPS
ncbi:hypothetical protein C5C43_05555, partial [Rathayibacter rathayi]